MIIWTSKKWLKQQQYWTYDTKKFDRNISPKLPGPHYLLTMLSFEVNFFQSTIKTCLFSNAFLNIYHLQ